MAAAQNGPIRAAVSVDQRAETLSSDEFRASDAALMRPTMIGHRLVVIAWPARSPVSATHSGSP
ncbi:MAG: hypothetical protein ACRDOE_18410 [Streptosporangiaceae bacterium]